jgi:hypothetical protein
MYAVTSKLLDVLDVLQVKPSSDAPLPSVRIFWLQSCCLRYQVTCLQAANAASSQSSDPAVQHSGMAG